MVKISKAYYLIFILMGLIGCHEALSPDPASLGYDYFPLNTGDIRIYNVLRIEHKTDLTSDTTRYQLKEVVGSTFTSGGEESYKLERYTRLTEADDWQAGEVWSARINNYQAVVVENNVPIIKLSFPLTEDRRWDGNAMNSLAYDEFKMINLGDPFIVETQHFVSSLEMVKEEALDPSESVTDSYHKEYFARGVGLIYRVDIDRKYCNEEPCPPSKIDFGLELEYKLIDYQLHD